MSIALVHGRVLTAQGFADDLAVVIEGRDIVAVQPHAELAPDTPRHDLQGAWLLPGFIDAQVNGGGGVLFNNAPTVDTLRRIGEAHRRFGTTGFLPTLISDDAQVMREAIAATRAAIEAGVPGVLGIHLEGPYIAPARKGTHDAGKFRVPDADEIAMASSLDNGITLITLAPEQVPADTTRPAPTRKSARVSTRACAASRISTTRCRRCRGAIPVRSAPRWRTATAGAV